jgi:ABC-type polar amino acid transport system ATPase subunit
MTVTGEPGSADPAGRAGAQPGPAAPEVITIRCLCKSFGERSVLRGIDLTVHRGEVISVIGKSGSGKSTLLRCLNLLEHPTSGTIEIGGQCVYTDGKPLSGRALVALRRRIGMVFQSLCLFPHLSAAENVALPLIRGLGLGDAEAIQRSLEFLGRVGLADRALDLPRSLSGGQQQRVAIARALALRPLALLFDEPTSALDPESTAEVLAVMRELSDDGMTMVVVTHELGFAQDVSERVAFIDDGAVAEIGSPAEVLRNPRQERTRAFVAQYLGRQAGSEAPAVAGMQTSPIPAHVEEQQ